MKAYSFYFNASDWLSSPAVKQMSLAERGAYIGLLAFAWGSDRPGTLPANGDKVRRIAEMSTAEWQESGETLLEKFPLSECATYRYNPRLLCEVEKERLKSERAAASANKRWQSERNANAPENDANASKKDAAPSNAQEQEQVVGKPTPSLRSVRAPKADMEAFNAFWKNYPRKEAKADALKAFGKLNSEQQAAAAEWARAYFARRPLAEWFAPDGRDVRPHPATWLNGERWIDLAEPASAGPGPRPATLDPETDRLRAFTLEQAALPAPLMVYRSAPNRPAHLQPTGIATPPRA